MTTDKHEFSNAIDQRKTDHITICCRDDIEFGDAGFSSYTLESTAVPEIDFCDIDTTAQLFGFRFAAPLMIAAMTGGVAQAGPINDILASLADELSLPMGLGSLKIMLKDSGKVSGFQLRKRYPKLFLIGNLGATEFHHGATIDSIKRLVDELELNAFAFHLNALQECIQPEGQRQFSGVLKFLSETVKALPIPIMVKEVGAGIGANDYARLAQTGVAAIDVGGAGGTSWARVEALRASGLQQRLGLLFSDWGIPTARAIAECKQEKEKSDKNSAPQIIATGGIRSGIEIAKAVALGASMAGVARPLLMAVVQPPKGMSAEESAREEIRFFVEGLKTAMFCSGAKNLSQIKLKRPLPQYR